MIGFSTTSRNITILSIKICSDNRKMHASFWYCSWFFPQILHKLTSSICRRAKHFRSSKTSALWSRCCDRVNCSHESSLAPQLSFSKPACYLTKFSRARHAQKKKPKADHLSFCRVYVTKSTDLAPATSDIKLSRFCQLWWSVWPLQKLSKPFSLTVV